MGLGVGRVPIECERAGGGRPSASEDYGFLERLAFAIEARPLADFVRLLMPAVALREPLANAALTSCRTGARSATTRIPWGFELASGLVIASIVRMWAGRISPRAHQLLAQSDVHRLVRPM